MNTDFTGEAESVRFLTVPPLHNRKAKSTAEGMATTPRNKLKGLYKHGGSAVHIPEQPL